MSAAARCKARRADGGPYGAPESLVDPLTRLCPSHVEGASERLSRIGRRGAEATHRRFKGKGLGSNELGPLENHGDAKRWLRLIGEAVVTGRLSNRDAQAGVKAVEAWLKAHSEGAVAKDVAELREALDALRKRGTLKAVP
jgi:hypothetical protein